MTSNLIEVIHEDGELLVVRKPAGLVCHPTKTDEYSSLISRARLYLGKDARPQLVNRLDRETSGVTMFAKTAAAARGLRALWESRQVRKEYLALVHGHVRDDRGLIDVPLGKDETSFVAIKDCVRPDGAPAQTEYWVERRFDKAESPAELDPAVPARHLRPFSLVRLSPRTGRKHQLRIHLAYLGHPLVGDKLYGGDEDLYLALVQNRLTAEQWNRLVLPHHALHAAEVRFNWQAQERVFQCRPEPWFTEFLP